MTDRGWPTRSIDRPPDPRNTVRVRRNVHWALALMLLTIPAAAQQQNARRQAGDLFQLGRGQYERGDYGGALKLFQRAYRLFPSYKIEVSIGYTLEPLSRLPEAAEYYERFLAAPQAQSDARQVRLVRGKLSRLRRRLSRISVRCPVDGAVIQVDGVLAAHTPADRALYLWPGLHQVAVLKDGRMLLQQAMTLERGGQRKIVVPARPQLDGVPEYGGVRRDVTQPPDVRPRSTPLHKRWWLWAGVGGVVLTAVLVGVLVSTVGRDDRLPTGDLGTIDMTLGR